MRIGTPSQGEEWIEAENEILPETVNVQAETFNPVFQRIFGLIQLGNPLRWT